MLNPPLTFVIDTTKSVKPDKDSIFNLTKKVVDGSPNGGKKEKEGGLITTWKEIRTAAGALPQKIRTIIVPLHKVILDSLN